MKRWLKYKAAKLVDMGLRVLLPSSYHRSLPQLSPSAFSRGKFLFVVLDHLGDAVMSTSAILVLKTSFPNCSLTVLTRPMNVPVFNHNPHVDQILTDEAPWWSARPVWECLQPAYWWNLSKIISRIRREKFDVIIDFRGDLRHLILFGAAASPRMLLGYGKTGGENLLSSRVPYDPSMHEIDKKLALLSPLGIAGVRSAPKVCLLPEELSKARTLVDQIIGNVRSPIILMDPGAKPVQCWPLERYALLAGTLSRRFKQAVLVSAGPLYSQFAEGLVRGAGDDSARFVGSIGLRDLMALVAVCDLVISSDTGITHIASAVGTKSVTLFGPTDPTRFWHGATGSRIVQSPEPCCSEELHETCLKPSSPVPGYCIGMISEEQVEDAVMATLSDLPLPEPIANLQSGPYQ